MNTPKLNVMKFLSTVLLALTIQLAMATTSSEPITAESNSVIVSFDSWKGKMVKVTILDDYGTAIYNDKVFNLEGKKRYQLSQLPDGVYTIRTSNDLRAELQNVTIDYGQITEVGEVTTNYKPIITSSASHWDVNYMNGDLAATVTITDSKGRMLYNRDYASRTLSKRYDLSTVPTGVYTITVSNGRTSKSSTIRR